MAEFEEDNLQKQIDEIEALSSIYEDNWTVVNEAARIFSIRITDQLPEWAICLQVMLPPEYPTAAPPVYQLNAPWLRGHERADLSNDLEEIYLWSSEPWFQIPSQKTSQLHQCPVKCSQGTQKETEEADHWGCQSSSQQVVLKGNISESLDDVEIPLMAHGEPITDRRSTFQAHLAPVVILKQVKLCLQKLYENKKIASATHNIYAYRIYCEDKRTFLQDCEDDGETAAGGRLLHLMQILDVRNVLVVVSRWYGGILLGPDRFKHINNCARNLLIDEGYSELGVRPALQLRRSYRSLKTLTARFRNHYYPSTISHLNQRG
ncbi:protein IMPACT isoform X2 [Hypanus sabinus]|uniref:protein IMPACT isoform X2 n=1 Tax=Hypanus sabinus TaxID=79690 RepID=UPI0028C40277|nr:protein IMPACT isoform X2 [Hypanus sabinus]